MTDPIDTLDVSPEVKACLHGIKNDVESAYKDRIAELEGAIRTFLLAVGHDLCHVNRVALATVLGDDALTTFVPTLVRREDFEAGCKRYADEIYGGACGG